MLVTLHYSVAALLLFCISLWFSGKAQRRFFHGVSFSISEEQHDVDEEAPRLYKHAHGLTSPPNKHPCEGCLFLSSLAEQQGEDGDNLLTATHTVFESG